MNDPRPTKPSSLTVRERLILYGGIAMLLLGLAAKQWRDGRNTPTNDDETRAVHSAIEKR